ncbi:MAG: copper chaperone PCu(A)C [Candidatus Thiodubiliella endoseptemdiera]|uniref:Copper chaperone PCu(A)C n=1 Tax=Candidatus Thiodubiliella endoseptemdiera TaxID=2738886 RepID=A0A853F4L8_9GAMM|nr:copper chaperone PCu(A)C [Candidatus Thiodubiliella endoseptemdiera]
MNKIITIGLLIFLAIFYVINSQKSIQIEGFYIVLPPSSKSASGYGIIKNKSNKPDVLIGVSSDDATVMLHQTQIHSNMANMVHHSKFSINAGNSLILRPMSYHLMLTHISKSARHSIKIKFEFKNAGIIEIKIPILDSHKYN